jgi:hypothetical protein
MTDDQIREKIRNGAPFFAVNSRHEMMARYMPFMPVFRWEKNQMVPTPLQGEDLIWWMKSRDEIEDTDPLGD